MSAFESAGWLNDSSAIRTDCTVATESVDDALGGALPSLAWHQAGDRTQDFATITKDNAYL